jgi:hypothetical protein
LTIRAEREKIAREYEARDSVLKEDMSQIEAVMLSTCNEINAESIKLEAERSLNLLKKLMYVVIGQTLKILF